LDHKSDRLKQLRKTLLERQIDALLISKSENLFYFTGFRSTECQCVVTEQDFFLVTDFRYEEAARETVPEAQVVVTGDSVSLFSFLTELQPSTLAVEEKTISHGYYRELVDKTKLPLVPGDGIPEALRMIKDASERKSISRAQELTDLCFSHMLTRIRPGRTELELAWEIERFLREQGAEALSFETICVSGPRTSLPHGGPTSRGIETGDFVTLDFGCIVDGYCSDMTRTVVIGKPSDEQRQVYDIVLQAQKAACNAIRANMSGKEADRAARDVIEEAGFGAAFGHGTGHGVGLEIHEAPTLNKKSEELLVENMVVTIEPGIYLPGKFGVRIEDLAFVTDSTIINKTKSEKELIVL
jgi:Xaa-Pro aminopeptidase